MANSPKNYTVRGMLDKSDEAEIARLLAKYPLWKKKHARAQVAARKFAQHIKNASPK